MSRKALIIDDSKTAFLVLSRMLKPYDISAKHAISGDQGIELLAQEDFDVIFLDQMMPDKTGTETIQEIKEHSEWASIPVMMFTAKTGLEYEKEVRALGAVGVLPKELNTEEIEKALTKIELWDPESDERFELKLDRRQPTSDEKLRVWLESFLENQFSPELSKKVQSATDDLRRDTIHYSKRMLNELAKTDKQQAMLKEVKGQTDFLKQLFYNSFKQYRLISALLGLGLLGVGGALAWLLYQDSLKDSKQQELIGMVQQLSQQNLELKDLVANQQYSESPIEYETTDIELEPDPEPIQLVGIDANGKYLTAKSEQGYLFLVTDQGLVDNGAISFYYLDANCSSDPYVDMVTGMVIRRDDSLYYTDINSSADSLLPMSTQDEAQQCQPYRGVSKRLKPALVNDAAITGVDDISYQLR
ncbi:MAG: response regulator [Gammaproteobacteria bacterium]|nr:response regulator [Gammaproteobacteria bacterium]